MTKHPAIYIMTNKKDGVLYTSVTSTLTQRVYQHKHSIIKGFTSQYGCNMLVYYEQFEEMAYAIQREKQLKAGSRKKKVALIEAMNPEWRDLYGEL